MPDKLGRYVKGEHPSRATEFKKGAFSREKHPFWKGGRHKLTTGYIVVNVPNHPRAYRNEVYEHIVVAEKLLGRYLLRTERVHHINGIKGDNRPENLIVFRTHGEHMRHHLTGKKRKGRRGKWLKNT